MTIAVAAGAFAAFVVSYLAVATIQRIAHRRAWLDHPTDRGLHDRPMPRGGGVAIVIVTTIAAAILLALNGWLDRRWMIVFAAALAVAVVSWIDDLRSLPNTLRFGVHLAAAVAAITAFGCIDPIAFAHDVLVPTGVLGCLLAVLWIAGLTNAYNFMDGSDGIAGQQAIVAGCGIAIVSIGIGANAVAIVALLLAAASAGFLIHNWSPARIFMGDVGSAFLGYLLAVLVLASSRQDPKALLAGVLILWPFIFDTTLTFLRRLHKGENVFAAHRTHLYQRLVQCGYSHAKVALLYCGLSLLGCAAAIVFMTQRDSRLELLAPAVIALAAVALWAHVVRTERARAVRASAASTSTAE